jgi:hypothetical protein
MFWSRGGKTHSQARLWGLAAGGILTRLNSENFDRIRFRCGREASRVCLRDWWSVNDPASLQDKLQWLWNRGHSGSCMELCDALSSSNAGQIAAEQGISSALCTFMLGNRNELRASRLVA